ncbi:hypothetical protein [Amycolatopsis sp. NPDC059021]|uniref:hypothetical protein n=1 Tax=Amycolatopsis sp. NPDC059021 TaxID=3346704 RepID=UPI00366BBD2C
MRTSLRNAVVAAMSGAVVLATATAAVATPAADAPAEAITCDSKASGKDGPFYNGPSASYAYDKRFGLGPSVPGLDTHTPQGIAAWNNWDGANDLLLVSSYQDGKDAHLIGIDPKSGKHIGTVAIAESHVGGIAVVRDWAFVQGAGSTIRKYKLSELKTAMKAGGVPYLKQDGEARKVYAASFISSYGNDLYAGKFNDKGRDKMYRYTVNADGSLTTQDGAYEVPMKTQGLMVTKDHFVYSTSYGNDNRSNLYVVNAGARDLDKGSPRCFRSPSMSEGIAAYGGYAYVVYESGSAKYMKEHPRNVIQNLHKGKISTL